MSRYEKTDCMMGTGAKSVGYPKSRHSVVPNDVGIKTSWDDHAIPIEQCHGVSQGHLLKAGRPEISQGGMTPQFGKAVAQMEAVFCILYFQPTPPTTDGMTARAQLTGDLEDR